MFQLFICLSVCILKCGVHFSCGTFLPALISPYESSINRHANLSINTQPNQTIYPLNVTIGHQKYSILLPTLSANNLTQRVRGSYNVTRSVNKPSGNNTRESRHLLHHLLYGLSHGGVKAASGSVSATHSFNLFGKQFNYAMGLSYGKPYYHVVSEVPGPYPYPNPGPDSTSPEPAATDSPDSSDSDDNDDNDNDGDDDGSDSPDESDEDGDNNDDDDDDDQEDNDDNASVSNYSKKSDEQSGCGKRRGNSHGCNASGSYENLTNKKKKKKIRKGTERPVTTSATRKKKPKNKPKRVPEKLQKVEPTTNDIPLGNRQFSRNDVQIRNEIDMPSTMWDLFYSSNRKSKDIHFPGPQGTPNPYLLSADKLKQLSKISKITI